jgi:thiol-disulfide isomerase/thioredoxin
MRTLAVLGLLVTGSITAAAGQTGVGVMPGDAAPPLRVSAWRRGAPLPAFEPGHVYLVSLWASWSAPCLSAMPHLKRLEEEHPEALTVVAMNVWELDRGGVPAFVRVHGDSMPARVAMDSLPPGKESNEGLMVLALQGDSEHPAIPRTYLIDQSGRVAWIGSPLEVDVPLSLVLGGVWDAAGFAEQYASAMGGELRYRELFAPLEAAVQAKNWEAALLASEAVAAADSAFGNRIANQGFAYVAMLIVAQEAPSPAEFALARGAVDRALELKRVPDWRLHLLGAHVARAAGDFASAGGYLDAGMIVAPPEGQARFANEKKSLE